MDSATTKTFAVPMSRPQPLGFRLIIHWINRFLAAKLFGFLRLMKPALLLLAAGMGSRYGGLKQIEPMGPKGETMIDYAVHDARSAGFEKVVFVIRKEFETAFREQVGNSYESSMEIRYAFQELEDLPEGHRLPEGRTKPWGTAHAVRAARENIQEPFAVINADDFYGAAAFRQMAGQLKTLPRDNRLHISMVGYILANTLSPHGTVNRGICEIENGLLRRVEEFTEIEQDSDNVIRGTNSEGENTELPKDLVVSMNFWGFSPAIFAPLEIGFRRFLEREGTAIKSEYYLPSLVDKLIKEGLSICPVLETKSPWFGVTYPGDKERVTASLRKIEAR